MHHVEAERGGPPLKYHGKWPFRRVLGMQARALRTRARLGC
jgi:hypothetical protein